MNGEPVLVSDAMIEFSCIYCGQPVRVGEELARRQIPCPACGHTIRVRCDGPGRAAEHWSRVSNEEIREAVLTPALPPAEQSRRAFKRVVAPWLPRYDDLTLFTFALAWVVLLAMDPGLRRALWPRAAAPEDNMAVALLVIVALGGLFSLVNVFFRREKSQFERTMMLFFAIVVTMGTGISAGRPMLSGGYGLLAVFPAWNTINGVFLVTMAGLGVLDDDCLTDERAAGRQVFLVTVAVTLLVAACHYLFKLDPLTTFSIAVAYAMGLHHAVRRLWRLGARCVRR